MEVRLAPTIPQGEPVEATAGDTWQWTKAIQDYGPTDSGGTWTLSYAIVGVSALLWDASYAVAGTGDWTVTIPASATAPLGAGTYRWTAILTGGAGNAGQRISAESGVLTVEANPDSLSAGDTLSFAETALTVVEAALSGRLTSDMEEFSIAGRAVKSIPIIELMSIRSRLTQEVWNLRHPNQAGRVRLVRFTGVT